MNEIEALKKENAELKLKLIFARNKGYELEELISGDIKDDLMSIYHKLCKLSFCLSKEIENDL